MVDSWAKETRSKLMGRVAQKDTAPELVVQRALHRAGFRFRLHRKDLLGKPDVVLPKFRTAVFVHGCFWHRHDCRKGRKPQSNVEFWTPKLDRNVERDRKAQAALLAQGWHVVTIWECSVEAELEQLLAQLQARRSPSDASK
jgi:DNA mismatch endonuclease (patch repair protein)